MQQSESKELFIIGVQRGKGWANHKTTVLPTNNAKGIHTNVKAVLNILELRNKWYTGSCAKLFKLVEVSDEELKQMQEDVKDGK